MSNVSTSSPVAAEWPLPNNGLSLAQMALATSLFVVLYTVVYMAGRAYFPREKTREKAWLLTTISSTGTSLIGLFYVCLLINYGTKVTMWAEDDVSKVGVIFFIVYLVLDLVFGYFEYPDQMNFLSGYFHHTFYISFLVFLWQCKLVVAFSLFLPCEIPTALMCYGQLNRNYRQDWAFGISFFITRVAYFAGLYYGLVDAAVSPFVLTGAGFVFLLHVYWFYSWVVSQRKKGVLKDLEHKYAHHINTLKSHGRNARNFVRKLSVVRRRIE